MQSVIAGFQQVVDAVIRWMIIVLMLVMTAIVFAQIFFRYVFNVPLGWSEELARFAFVWVSFIGASALMRVKEHINVTVFTDLFPVRMRAACIVTANLCAMICVYFFLVGGIELTRNEWGQLAPALQIPMGWVYIAIPVAATLMGIWILLQTIESAQMLVRGK
jgi:TRAP-type C4-dicarboxylate transport system permease small subunit